MNKSLFASLALLATLFSSPAAEAHRGHRHNDVKDPLWVCDLHFQAKGRDIQLIIGHNRLRGSGQLTCVDTSGRREIIPLYVEIGTPPVALRLSFRPAVNIYGYATGIGIATDPEDLIDDYQTVEVTAAVGVGAGVGLALQGNRNSATINLGIQGLTRSFGFAVGHTIVSLYRLD